MHKRIALFSFTLVMLCLSTLAQADANPLLETWQLKSFVREVAGSGPLCQTDVRHLSV